MWLPIVGFMLVAVWVIKGNASAEAPAMPDRAPPENEIRQILTDLRATLGNVRDELERQHDHHDEELQAIGRKLNRIEGQLDRIETRRLDDALVAIYRQQKET